MRGWTRRGALTALGAGAASACTPKTQAPPYEGAVTFQHGVASGDPRADSVIIWTRVTPGATGAVPVRWVIARNRELTDVVKTGVVEANETRDYTVKVDVTGLRAGAPYFYGFLAGDQTSPVGRTRTLPTGRLDALKFAVLSCASFTHGFFNVYEAVSEVDDLDLVLHLGDYIYEYGLSGYGGAQAITMGRIPAPQVECISLNDYRLRHAQAKAEAELQAAHAAAPWVVVWDDHEIANDAWTGGADNHQPNEGPFDARKRAALQAYYEWMPIREPEAGGAFEAINRSFQFGDLFTLIMLETRLLGRTQQFDYNQMPIEMRPWDFTNPNAPVPLAPDAAQSATTQMLPQLYEDVAGEARPVLDWRRVGPAMRDPRNPPRGMFFLPDMAALEAALASPERSMLGEPQERWLGQQLSASRQSGTAWRIIGNQSLMAGIVAPDLSRAPAALSAMLETLRPGVTQLLALTRRPIPASPDGWDGYRANRARVYDLFRRAGPTLVVTGDSHAAWAIELDDGQGRVAVELGGTSVTSPSDASYFTQAGLDFVGGVRERNPQVKWTEHDHRGFLVVTLTKALATAEFFAVSTVSSKDYDVARAAAFTVAAEPNGAGPLTAV